MSVVIIGGGIAGLGTAIALRRVGIDATVYDRVPDLAASQVGAGLGMSYNATRVLRALGVLDDVTREGERGERFEFRTWKGDLLSEWATDPGEVQLFTTREALYRVLVAALPPDKVVTGKNCVGFVEQDPYVMAVFDDGTTARGRLLIGADGLRSLIRTKLIGDPPRYAGFSVLRCVVPATGSDNPLPRRMLRLLWGPGGCFGMYHVAPRLAYVFGWRQAPEGERIPRGQRKEAFLERYREWSPDVGAMIQRASEDAIHQTDIYDRPPVKTWSRGRVTLVGDAAHAMTFTMGQGAAQGLEDAVVLARCVASEGETPTALEMYEAERVPRAAKFIRTSARISRMSIMSNPGALKMRDHILAKASTNMTKADAELKIDLDWRTAPSVVFNTGPLAGARIFVAYPFVVGRHQADLTLEDAQLSRRHAAVRRVDGDLEIEDLGSANGTFVNGLRIDRPTRLRNGDRVQLGASLIEVRAEPPRAPTAPEPAKRGRRHGRGS